MRKSGSIRNRRVLSQVRRYMLWDCSSCGTKGINAHSAKQCPQCGSPKELDDIHEKEYRSRTLVNKNYKHRGADISCQSCGSENKKRFSCRNCGQELDPKFAKQVARFNGRTDADWRTKRVQVETHGYVEDATETPWDTTDSHVEPVVLQEPKPVPPMRPSAKTRVREAQEKTVRVAKDPKVNRNPLVWITVAAVLTLLAIVGGWLYHKANSFFETTATPVQAAWSYSLPQEDYAARYREHIVEDGQWWSPPGDAFKVDSEHIFIRHEPIYEDVWITNTCSRTGTDSYTDTDGTWVTTTYQEDYDCSGYESQHVRDESIYGTQWEYYVMRWESIVPLTASNTDQNPVFPVFVPTDTLRASGPAVEQYSITFSYNTSRGNESEVVRYFDRSVWADVRLHEPLPAIINGLGSLEAISGLDAEYEQLRSEAQ